MNPAAAKEEFLMKFRREFPPEVGVIFFFDIWRIEGGNLVYFRHLEVLACCFLFI